MNKPENSNPSLPEKAYQYYANHGFAELIKYSAPFLTKKIVNQQKISVEGIVSQSNKHRSWRTEEENPISISEPKNKKLREKFEFYQKEFDPQTSKVYEIKDCDLIGPNAVGLYKGKNLILETSGNRTFEMYLGSRNSIVAHSIKSQFGIRPTKSKTSVFPLISPDPSYYHWMMEYLPKLRLFEFYQKVADSDPTLIIEPNPRNFIRETLKAAGYDKSQYDEWDENKMRVKNLITTTHRSHAFNYEQPELSDYTPSQRDIMWLRNRMRSNVVNASDNTDTQKKIYVSRQEAERGRKVINKEKVFSILKKHGFDIHILEKSSFEEQIKIFHDADVIMGPHGAGLLNMIFAEQPAIVELFPKSIIKPHFYFLSDILGFEYKSIITEYERNNLIVDTDELDMILAQLCSD